MCFPWKLIYCQPHLHISLPPFPSLVKALRCWSIFVWLDLAQSGAWVRANLSQLWSFHTWKAANPCLLHSKLCYQHKCFVTHVTNKSAKLESTAARQLGWFHTWREVKQPPAWQQPQPGTIISFLAMHTAQITQKYFKNIAQILQKYCSDAWFRSSCTNNLNKYFSNQRSEHN